MTTDEPQYNHENTHQPSMKVLNTLNSSSNDTVESSDAHLEKSITRIESVCMNCEENGETIFYLTSVPHFRDIIISSFECPHCHFKNNDVQFGGYIQPQGKRITCKVQAPEDLNRQVIKGQNATVRVHELDFEVPEQTQSASITTIEGILSRAHDQLTELIPYYRLQSPEQSEKLEQFLVQLKKLIDGQGPFTFELDDFSGNSHIESLDFTHGDPQISVVAYDRSDMQNIVVGGFNAPGDTDRHRTEEEIAKWRQLKQNPLDAKQPQKFHSDWNSDVNPQDPLCSTAALEDVLKFPTHCSLCTKLGEERIISINIPYFKQVIIMSFDCTECGYRNNEVKSSGPISTTGKRLLLLVKNQEDLSRDILKSNTAKLMIPELDFELEAGSLGGRFTTVEGIVRQIHENLKNNVFMSGDSATPRDKSDWDEFLNSLNELANGKSPFTLIIDDPVTNSYIQSFTAPDPDPQITEELYVRSKEQDEDLGLDKMKTSNYSQEYDHVQTNAVEED